jgi:nicotinamide-nucleotide amidase
VISEAVLEQAAVVLAGCRARGWKIATAESCTGGLIAAALTAIAGASDVVDRGFVTYSNEAKMELLGVPQAMLTAHGAISEQVVRAMAEGALARSRATITVAVTGIAGPGGGSVEKPVGLVWFGLGQRGHELRSEKLVFPGDRTSVRTATVAHAFGLIRGRF